MTVTYCAPADVRNALSGTDAGTGTAAQLTDTQMNAAILTASDEVSSYAGTVYDSSSPQAVPPSMIVNLTISLAMFYATVTYLKGKSLSQDDPVRLRYDRAIQILSDVRDGKVRIDPQPPGQITETGMVINRIPRIFTHADSNTVIDVTGTLQADSPPDSFSRVFARGEF